MICKEEQSGPDALEDTLAEQALSVMPNSGGSDHRLATYRTVKGQLMCIARAGVLVSEVLISAALCGTDQGCDGKWRCLSCA